MGVKRPTALPDGKDQMHELAHGVADGDGLLLRMLGDQARVQRLDRRVTAAGAERGHPQVAADQVVAAPAHDEAAWGAGLTVPLDTTGHLDRQHTEVGDQLAGHREAVAVEEEGGQHGRGDGAAAGNGVEVVGLRRGAIGRNQQGFQAFLACADVAELADLLANQRRGRGAVERGDRRAGQVEERGHVLVGERGDGSEVGGRGLGQQPGGGIAVDEFEHPAGSQVLGEQGQLREGQGEQVVELVDQAGALADDGLQAAGDLAEAAEFE